MNPVSKGFKAKVTEKFEVRYLFDPLGKKDFHNAPDYTCVVDVEHYGLDLETLVMLEFYKVKYDITKAKVISWCKYE